MLGLILAAFMAGAPVGAGGSLVQPATFWGHPYPYGYVWRACHPYSAHRRAYGQDTDAELCLTRCGYIRCQLDP